MNSTCGNRPLKRVAVFGNAGGGKSTLSKKLAEMTGLPLHVLDKIQFSSGGTELSDENYRHVHHRILDTERWIIDGFGSLDTLWVRLDAADTLIFVDLPLYVHFWWVTKRMITGRFKPPEGWSPKSPIFKSSMLSYRVLWLCHKRLTPKYREYVAQAQKNKIVYHLRSAKQISQLLELLQNEQPGIY